MRADVVIGPYKSPYLKLLNKLEFEDGSIVTERERWERRLRRIKRPERVAAVSEGRWRIVAEDIRWVPQQIFHRDNFRLGIRTKLSAATRR